MILLRQALRSIWRGKRSYIACVTLLAIGIAVYVSYHMLHQSLDASVNRMYETYRFADVFAEVRSMPLNALQPVERITGVEQATPSLVQDSRVQMGEDGDRVITLRLISFDPEEESPVNGFHLKDGAIPAGDEIAVGETFLGAHGLGVGDTITLVLNRQLVTRRISGVIQSPAYIYAIQESGQLLPDEEGFGYACLPYDELAALTGLSGRCNRVDLRLEEGTAYSDVKGQLEDTLGPHGLINLYQRKDQMSHAMVTTEIEAIGSMATALPMLFLLIAVIILYIMLKRVIEQERGQIGTLMAFGFTRREILLHYVCYGAVTGLAGGLLGAVFGAVMASGLTQVFLLYFHVPDLGESLNLTYVIQGFVLSLLAGSAGGFFGTRSVLRLKPSEAMRPPAPPAVRFDLVGRLPALRLVLAQSGFMALRNITRNRFRSAFVLGGMACSYALITFMASYTSMFDTLLLDQFQKVQLYDLKIELEQPRSLTQAVESAWGLAGVTDAEGMLEVPVELRSGHLKEGVLLTGLDADSTLYHIYDSESGDKLTPAPGGVILSATLAHKLEVVRGDLLWITTPYTGQQELPLPVLELVSENLGGAAYTELESLCRLLDLPRSANSVVVRTENLGEVKAALLDGENISALTDKGEAQKVYENLLESFGSLIYLLRFAGMGIAFAIILSTSSISLSERKREYATLRVLGMHPREIGQIAGFEYGVLAAVGMLLGIPLVRIIKTAMQGLVSNELFSIPLSTPVSCYIEGALLVAVTVLLCNRLAARQIARFDMVEVLKERE